MAKKKSETRIAFEKMFASERRKRIKAGLPGDGGVFTFRGKKYTTDYAKSKKKAAPKKKKSVSKDKKEEYWNPTANKKSKYAGKKRKKTASEKKSGKAEFRFYNKKKLGGFKDDSFLEGPTPTLFED